MLQNNHKNIVIPTNNICVRNRITKLLIPDIKRLVLELETIPIDAEMESLTKQLYCLVKMINPKTQAYEKVMKQYFQNDIITLPLLSQITGVSKNTIMDIVRLMQNIDICDTFHLKSLIENPGRRGETIVIIKKQNGELQGDIDGFLRLQFPKLFSSTENKTFRGYVCTKCGHYYSNSETDAACTQQKYNGRDCLGLIIKIKES